MINPTIRDAPYESDDRVKGFYIRGNHALDVFYHTREKDDIDRAIAAYEEAAACLPQDDPRLGNFLHKIGIGYAERYKRFGELDNLQAAIDTVKQGIAILSDEDPELPSQLRNLGTAFCLRFERTGDLNDISEAIKNEQRAVLLTPDGSAAMPGHLSSLGISLLRRFQRTGDLDDISAAIKFGEWAVELSQDGDAELSGRISNLGISFLCRFERGGDLDDVSEAIKNQRRAVQLTPVEHSDLPIWLINLGNSFLRRFQRTADLDDLSEAIDNQRRAVQLTPDGHPNLQGRLNNLGVSLFRRFQRTADVDDISETIDIQQRALQLTQDDHASLPIILNNLGNSFSGRFELTGNLDDISQAIEIQRRSVQLAPDGHPNLPDWLTNLGISFVCRFERDGDPGDITEAIDSHRRAVLLTPNGHADLPVRLDSLGNSFVHCFERNGDLDSLSEAMSSYRDAATSATGPPSVRLGAATRWATLSQKYFPSPQLLDAHECIIRLLSLVAGLENTIHRRHQSLVKFSQLSIAASAAALSMGCPDKALEWLTEGRCIVWNQINQLRTPVDKLRAHDQALAERFSAISIKLENAGIRSESSAVRSEIGPTSNHKISLEEEAAKHIKLTKEWDHLLVTIRNIPGFEDFLQPKQFADIMDRLPDDGAIVIINIHDDRCDALALMAGTGKPTHIPLPEFSYQEAERLAKGLYDYLLHHGVITRIGTPLDEPEDPLDVDLVEVLSILWSRVVWPILEALAFSVPDTDSTAQLPRIWWCPTGPLSFLPIHAAGIHFPAEGIPKQCLSDFAVSSYIPTINTLLKTPESNPVKQCSDAPTGLLIVSQPNTPNKTPIPYAEVEAEKVSKIFDNRQIPSITLCDMNGTIEGVLTAMQSFPSIHFACHASQNTTDPLKSSLYLHDGLLELSQIMRNNFSDSDFAFLSACQTSMGDKKLSEEVVHLAAGMLTAGYQSVVGTMWSIFDKHGADIAEIFYQVLLDETTDRPKTHGAGAARALHCAMQRFREEIADSPDSLLIWVPYIHTGI